MASTEKICISACIFRQINVLCEYQIKILLTDVNNMELTKSELEVMNVLWAAGRPLSRNDILNLSVDKSWKDSSIHILLNGLLKKGAIVEAGFVKCVKTYGRLYAANISCADYYANTVFTHRNKEILPLLFSAFIDSNDMTPDMVDKLEEILKKRKAEFAGND